MNIETAVNVYEIKHNVRIDYARPQSWFDAVNNANVQINPQDYVWAYGEGIFGKPLHKATIILDSIREDFAMERATLLKELEHAKDRIEGYDKVFEIAKQ